MKQHETVVDGLVRILQEREIITEKDAQALKEDFKRREAPFFEDFLLEEGIVDKEVVLDALQEFYQVQAIDVLGEVFDHDLVKMFPKDVLLRNFALPYRRDENVLFVITNNPRNEDLDMRLREFVSYDIEFLVGIPTHIDMTIKEFYQDPLYDIDYEGTIEETQEQEEEEREQDLDYYREL
ncbi:MAG: hypothetical protein JW725_03365 [Candidatus Babeliaceae bacterium]|nr:hypothetical protein [Candidatus Babeliaceae bacterium]